MKRYFSNIRRWIRYKFITYPDDARLFEGKYQVGDWIVYQAANSVDGIKLEIYFKGEKIAETKRKMGAKYLFDGIDIEPGWEKFEPLVRRVMELSAESVEKKDLDRRQEKEKLYNTALSQIEFLGE